MDFSFSKNLERDEVLFFQDSPPPLTYVDKGLVKFYILNSAGKERIIFLGSQGQFLSGLGRVNEECRLYLQAKQDSRVLFFEEKDLQKNLEQGRTEKDLIESLFKQMNFLVREIKDLTFNNFSARLAGLLVYLVEEFGKKELLFSHQEIADMLGVSRVTVTRVLGDFAKEGLIDKKRKKVTVRDISGLKMKTGGE